MLDGHSIHTKSLELIDKARDAGVILFCFPPHCTHKLQPLDVTFMKPLSLYYSDEVKRWLREHAKDHRVVTQFQIASLFGEAYLKASSMTTAISGFRATGIWPVDANIFQERDFLASAATDIDLNVSVSANQSNISNSVSPVEPNVLIPSIQTISLPTVHPEIINPSVETNGNSTLSLTQHDSPGCSHWPAGAEKPVRKELFALSPEEILPIPKSNKTTARISKRRGKTAILTESPYKNELLAANICSTPKPVKRSLSMGPKKKTKTSKKNLNKKTKNDEKCLYCSELYSTSVDGWIQCLLCKKWAHCLCAGIEETHYESIFNCELCS